MWLQTPVTGNSLPVKTLCLTFDDGPGSDSAALAEYLAFESVPATFFLVGKHLREVPTCVGIIRACGHMAANHSFNHPHLTNSFLAVDQIIGEVRQTSREIGGTERPIFFRPPYGAWSPRLAHFLSSEIETNTAHFGPVNWDVGGFDFEYWLRGKSADACAEAYLKQIRKRRSRNGIVLFHDGSADLDPRVTTNRTLELVRILVPTLKKEGHRFAALSAIPQIRSLLQTERAALVSRPIA